MTYDYIIHGCGISRMRSRISSEAKIRTHPRAPSSRREDATSIRCSICRPAFAKMTKGIAAWGFSTVPQRHLGGRALRYTQAKVLGGGSRHQRPSLCPAVNPQDYDAWDAGAATGWSYNEGSALFQTCRRQPPSSSTRITRAAGRSVYRFPINPLPISEAFLRAGQEYGIPYNPDFNGARQEGVGTFIR